MSQTALLPEEFKDLHGNPLQVDDWVFWGYRAINEQLHPAYLWHIEEPEPGNYVVKAYGYNLSIPVTPQISVRFRKSAVPISKRIRLDHYSDYLTRFHDKKITAYFQERSDFDGKGPVLLMNRKGVGNVLVPLPDLEHALRDQALFGKWLEQMLWRMLHPGKAEILNWATEEGKGMPYGYWPLLATNKELDKAAKEWKPVFLEYLAELQENDQEDEDDAMKILRAEETAMGTNSLLLPPPFRSVISNEYPLTVGGWVTTLHLGEVPGQNFFYGDYIWQIQEAKGNKYILLGYSSKSVIEFTPDLSSLVYPMGINISERLDVGKYSKYWEVYIEHGISFYFQEHASKETALSIMSVRGQDREPNQVLVADSMVKDMQDNPALFESWLDQMIWAQLNRSKAQILFWAMQQSIPAFGLWPDLLPPIDLGIAAELLFSRYQEDQNRMKSPNEIVAESNLHFSDLERQRESRLLQKLRIGELDTAITPRLLDLLSGTGVKKSGD